MRIFYGWHRAAGMIGITAQQVVWAYKERAKTHRSSTLNPIDGHHWPAAPTGANARSALVITLLGLAC